MVLSASLDSEQAHQETKKPRVLPYRFVRSARRSWQLQNSHELAFAQVIDKHDLPIGKFQRIVMYAWLVLVDLTKPGDRFRKLLVAKERAATLVFDLLLKSDLRAGTQAHGHVGFAGRGKAAGYGVIEPS